jgi:hypothetical protein
MKRVLTYLRCSAVALCVGAVLPMLNAPRSPGALRVHLTTGESGTIARVYATGNARLAIGNGAPVVRRDTLRLAPPVQLVVDVAEGDVHFEAEKGGVAVSVEPSGTLPKGLAAAGHHVVLRQGGTQILAQDAEGR